jgi:hypothetical protein
MAGPSLATLTIPVLATLPTADRLNVACSHDSTLPDGPLQVFFATVVAQQVSSRF